MPENNNIRRGSVVELNRHIDNEALREGVKKSLSKKSRYNLDQSATYSFLDENMKELRKIDGAPCFADLVSNARGERCKNARYIKYHVDNGYGSWPDEYRQISIKFLDIAILASALGPTDQSGLDIMENGFVIDIFNPWYTVDRTFAALCICRHTREARNMVNTVVDLYELGYPFWLAYIFAHGYDLDGVGHSWLGFSAAGYGQAPFRPRDHIRDIGLVRYLAKYFDLNNFLTNEDHSEPLINIVKNKAHPTYRLRSTEYFTDKMLAAKCNKFVKHHFSLLSSKAKDAYFASTDEEFNKIFEELK